MTNSLEKAVKKLQQGGYTLVVVNGSQEFTSNLTGLSPLLNILKNTPEILRGACVADKIVGKAAAVLFLYGGVKELYAEVISSYALPVLEDSDIKLIYNKKVPTIKNRAGTDTCPMEKRVLNIDNPEICADLLLKLNAE
jgi:hypothetical protein